MSAIAGIYQVDGKHIDSSIVSLLTDALAHRGPDGCATWLAGPVGLGHCMLWTTLESLHEHLPLTSDDGLLTITADARIDNRDELISDLNLSQHGEIIPDSSLILYAYQRWGESCVDHLLGDFAFAIWDAHKQHLFCARDHMGVKPFYYYRSDDCFAFASEIKSLFSLPDVPKEVNEEEVVNYLAAIWEDPQITPYHHIFRLPAAHTMTVAQSGLNLHGYWHLDPRREIHYDSNEEYERAFREIFIDAVRCRLRSAFPIGFLLSGGLDSSSVVCSTRDIVKQGNGHSDSQSSSIHTISAIFHEVPECNERDYIRTVLANSGFSPHCVEPARDSPLVYMKTYQRSNGDLLNDKNLLLFWQVYQHAQEAGVRTLIDGFFGDTAVSYGGGCLADLTRKMKWGTVFKEAVGISRHWHIPLWKILWQQVFLLTIPPELRSRWHTLRKHPNTIFDDSHLINTRLAQRYNLAAKVHFREEKQWLLKTARELHHFDLTWSARQRDFENLDGVASAFNLDLRHPFSDRRLIEFCLALPPEQKVRGGYTRAILRYALAASLPEEIKTRAGKADLDLAFYSGIRASGELDLGKILFCEPQLIAQYIDITLLREAYDDFMKGTNKNAAFLWRAAFLVLWLQHNASHVDQ